MLLQDIISQSNIGQTEEFVEVVRAIPNLLRVGDWQFVKPSVLWQDNRTFFSADKPFGAFNNQIIMIQIDHNSGEFYFTDVGIGTDEPDEFNHPVPFVWLEDGYVYCGQTNTHNDPIDVYKSNSINDIRSGFTKLPQILGNNAYPQLFKTNDNKTVFAVRLFPQGVGNFNLAVQKSDAGIEGDFTEVLITENTSGYRNYNGATVNYGTQTFNYVISNIRNDSNDNKYFASALFKTTDFITYSNFNDSFSKNVVVDGAISVSDISANFMINGSFDEDLEDYGFFNSIMVNDVIYGVTIKESTTDYYIFKIENGELETVLLNVPNIDKQFFAPFLYFNGLNLIISVRTDDGVFEQKKELWGISTDLLTQTKVYEFTDFSNFGRPIYLPDNLDQVNGEYAMCVDSGSGEAIFVYTSNKFFI